MGKGEQAFNHASELDLIQQWMTQEDARSDTWGSQDILDNQQQMMALAFQDSPLGMETSAPKPERLQRSSIMQPPVEREDPDVEGTGSLRYAALEQLCAKLDPLHQGYVGDIVDAGDEVVVIHDDMRMTIPLSPYERGLLEYAMPRIRKVVAHEGRVRKARLMKILKSILFPEMQHSPSPGRGRTVLTPPTRTPGRADMGSTDPRYQGAELGADATTPRRGSPIRGSPTPVRNLFPASPDSRAAGNEGKKETSGVGSSLLTLIEKVYKKLDPDGIGYLTNNMLSALPQDLTPFESSLIDLCHNRLVFQMERGGYKQLPKQDVLKMLCQAMEADFAADPKDGAVKLRSTDKKKAGGDTMPLETAMRSVYREARKQRSGKFGYVKEDPASVCTFKPAINRLPPESSGSPVKRAAPSLGQLSRPMSTRDMQEYVELQECTFQPNLHKCIGSKAQRTCRWYWDDYDEGPRYRAQRRPAREGPPRLRKNPQWVETLRGGWGAGKPPTHHVQPPKEDTHDPPKVVQPEMAFTLERTRQDLNGPLGLFTAPDASGSSQYFDGKAQGERDWGKYIRLHGRGFEVAGERLEDDDEEAATADFAEKFLHLRRSGSKNRSVFV